MEKKFNLHLVGGFLGSGKTTAIQGACQLLVKQGLLPGVITNDQGNKLVDGAYFNSLQIPGGQVENGCFCCRFSDLDRQLSALRRESRPDILFAESVGSCADLVATVLKPLQLKYPQLKISFSVFADVQLLQRVLSGEKVFEENVEYIYLKQLEEASIIVINKSDLVSPLFLEQVREQLRSRFGEKIILIQNSLNGENIQSWLKTIAENPGNRNSASLQIDYQRYGNGEAMLAWYDDRIQLVSGQQIATKSATAIIREIIKRIREQELPVGHLKFLLNDQVKISYTQYSSGDLPLSIWKESGAKSSLLINARVQCEPEMLEKIMEDALAKVTADMHCMLYREGSASFKPGFPVPEFRIA